MSSTLSGIRIKRAFPIFGDGDSLEARLRKVGLRGFPEVRIYEHATMQTMRLSSGELADSLYVSQPHLYRTNLDRITELADLFEADGIDIFNLDQAYDYQATDVDGVVTEWTMLPPVVEKFAIPRHAQGGFDYSRLIGTELKKKLMDNAWELNPALSTMHYGDGLGEFGLVNDGAHRVHAGFERGGVTVLEITGMRAGFPYYAAPQPYSTVQVFASEVDSVELKQHVLTAPGHKQLYRQFPSAGIMSGSVRPPREGELIV